MNISEIREVTGVKKANELLQDGWCLLNSFAQETDGGCKMVAYILGDPCPTTAEFDDAQKDKHTTVSHTTQVLSDALNSKMEQSAQSLETHLEQIVWSYKKALNESHLNESQIQSIECSLKDHAEAIVNRAVSTYRDKTILKAKQEIKSLNHIYPETTYPSCFPSYLR